MDFARSRRHAFTLLEVALIVAIIGMMLMMIVGYLFASKTRGTGTVAPASPTPAITSVPLPVIPPPFNLAKPAPAPATPAATPGAPEPAPPDAATPQPLPKFR